MAVYTGTSPDIHVLKMTGEFPDWAGFAPVLIDGDTDPVTISIGSFTNGEYLAQQNPDGSYTVDVDGYIVLSTFVTFPHGEQWRIGFDGIAPIDPAVSPWRASFKAVGTWWARKPGAAPYGYLTGMLVADNVKLMFYNLDGTDLVHIDGAAAVSTWDGYIFYFTIRFHAIPAA